MKTRWYVLLLFSGLVAGCVWLPKAQNEKKPEPPPVTAAAPTPPKPKRPTALVAPEQVNETNAKQMAQTLWDELDRDSQSGMGSGKSD